MAYVNINSRTTSSITAQLLDLDSTYQYSGRVATWEALRNGSILDDSTSQSIGANAPRGNPVTLSGLQPGTSYTIRCTISNIVGSSDVVLTAGTSTLVDPDIDTERPEIWGVSASQIKSGSNYNVLVTWSASDNEGIDYQWAYRSPPNNTSLTSVGSNLSSSARSYLFTTDANGNSFTAGNTYYFRIRVIDTSGNMSIATDGDTSLTIISSRPNDWNWEYTIQSGGNFYSQNGKTAYIMRASHWNSFTARINQFRDYKGLSAYSFTSVVSETNATRAVINQAINAINDMLSIGKMNTLLAGDSVKAQTFIDLRNKLNSIA